MKLPVYAQGLTKNLELQNTCEEVFLGEMDADEVLNILSQLHRPEDYEYWDCGITLTVARTDQEFLIITFNAPNSFTVVENTVEDQKFIGDSMTFQEMDKILRDYIESTL
ncbi:MAG: hypothetical protein F7C32_02765 [Desulfurococcales archaeon]|nr:hypothetical protein [Desulfurococcales archaeon]